MNTRTLIVTSAAAEDLRRIADEIEQADQAATSPTADKIGLIKFIRLITGLGLLDAKTLAEEALEVGFGDLVGDITAARTAASGAEGGTIGEDRLSFCFSLSRYCAQLREAGRTE